MIRNSPAVARWWHPTDPAWPILDADANDPDELHRTEQFAGEVLEIVVADTGSGKSVTLGALTLDARGAHVYIPRQDHDYMIEVGLRMLTLRHVVVERDGRVRRLASGCWRTSARERPEARLKTIFDNVAEIVAGFGSGETTDGVFDNASLSTAFPMLANDFVAAIREHRDPLASGATGLRILEATTVSLSGDGAPVKLGAELKPVTTSAERAAPSAAAAIDDLRARQAEVSLALHRMPKLTIAALPGGTTCANTVSRSEPRSPRMR